ncbi:MAG: helix-turn-helix transcriptional regulator [Deltaproteobacteria bacterium]|nr:helix-turn-helix transcriptional regulator [Deltaproteobacteria bacterium]
MESNTQETQHVLPDVLKVVGSRIRTIRNERNMNQKRLAELSNLDRAYMSSIEQGKQNITVGSLLRIASALKVDIRTLIP